MIMLTLLQNCRKGGNLCSGKLLTLILMLKPASVVWHQAPGHSGERCADTLQENRTPVLISHLPHHV